MVGKDYCALRLSVISSHQALEVLLALDNDLDADERMADFVEGTCNIVVDVESLGSSVRIRLLSLKPTWPAADARIVTKRPQTLAAPKVVR